MELRQERNNTVDFIRGFAILIVILGHTISTNNIIEYENTIIFKIIFSIQMPLFMLVSGYVTIFSKPILTKSDLFNFFKKRTITYLLPWFVWSIIIIGILKNGWNEDTIIPNITNLLWHMDSGYWFLFSLWTICMIWGLSSFIANKLSKKLFANTILTTIISIIPAIGLIVIGKIYGFSFLAIKLSLYYLLFFFIGYYSARLHPWLKQKKWYIFSKEILFFIAFLVYFVLTLHFNNFLAEETTIDMSLRIICSLSGCIVFIYFLNYFISKYSTSISKISSILVLAGQQSLGLYVSHNLFLDSIRLSQETPLNSFAGFEVCAVNYIITVFLSSIFVWIISSTKLSRFVLLGKN